MATQADTTPAGARQPRQKPRQQPLLRAGRAEHGAAWLVLAAMVGGIAFGWVHRADGWIDPHHGLGYALGIIGAVMMLVLLGYPLRKRMRAPRARVGSVGFWFRFHMLLGLFGPLAILYHARFSWGALNSAFAMGSMIVVATSGLVGRYFYSRVHRGYSDRKLELRALRADMDGLLAAMERAGLGRDQLAGELVPFETRAIAAGGDFWRSAGAVVSIGLATRGAERRLRRHLAGRHDPEAGQLRAAIAEFFEAVRRAAAFAFYDRLLRLWHLLHLPLFILLVGAAILHVIAVNMY